jgi:hypothetical protein
MHWPAAFVPGQGNVPKTDSGKVILDEVTYSEVHILPYTFWAL